MVNLSLRVLKLEEGGAHNKKSTLFKRGGAHKANGAHKSSCVFV